MMKNQHSLKSLGLFLLMLGFIIFCHLPFVAYASNTSSSAPVVENCDTSLEIGDDDYSQVLLTAFKTIVQDPSIYECAECHLNSIRLFFAFKAKVPQIRPEDFKVLLVSNNNDMGRFRKGQVLRPNEDPWRWHATLQYKNIIFDLDRESAHQVTNETEFANWLLKIEQRLWVWKLPGERFLKKGFLVLGMTDHALFNLSEHITPAELTRVP